MRRFMRCKLGRFPKKCLLFIPPIVLTIILVYKFSEEIYYIYNPYSDQICEISQNPKYCDVYVDPLLPDDCSTYITRSGFTDNNFRCPYDSSQKTIMNWKDYQNIAVPKEIRYGGIYAPVSCFKAYKVAILVPYRKRELQLSIFAENIHKFLVKQNFDYRLFIVHQNDSHLFNRGALFNAAFIGLNISDAYDCIVLHDIDSFPTNLLNRYDCVTSPRHLKVVDEHSKKIAEYRSYTGGVTCINSKQYGLVNGFSNLFWGWGLEDDDFNDRLKSLDFYMKRPSDCIASFHNLKEGHTSQYTWSIRRFLLYNSRILTRKSDGLNSISYKYFNMEERPLFTFVHVSLNAEEINKCILGVTVIWILLYLLLIIGFRNLFVRIFRINIC